MNRLLPFLALPLFATVALANDQLRPQVSEFIFDNAPFQSCHASTIEVTSDGTLLAAWFGGKEEGDPSVEIWLSRKVAGGEWTPPVPLTDYPEIPCWNPVLFRDAQHTVWLFFKVGTSPRTWVGGYKKSTDGGVTWSEPEFLPAGLLGPIKNKPIQLSDGTILSGTSVEAGIGPARGGVKPYWSWTGWVERSTDGGKSWSSEGPVTFPGVNYGLIQPTLWEATNGEIRMLLRATQQIGEICLASSEDGGATWSTARKTGLPNPNSGLDAVKLNDGRVLLVYNHTKRSRSPLNINMSTDDGETWGRPLVLESEKGEFSYPAVIQSPDGSIHITYTWNRKKIRYLKLDPPPF